jgi:hypothetical protein
MSLITPSKKPTFKTIASEEELELLKAFFLKHQRVFMRLADAFDHAPASIEDGVHVLADPLFFTVDAQGVALSRKEPKRKRADGNCGRVTFLLRARQQGEHGTNAIALATAIGTLRMQQAIQMADLLAQNGVDPTEALDNVLAEYAAQIESMSYWFAIEPPTS